MLGAREELRGGRPLHDLPQVHHGHVIAEIADHAQIVRDEDHGESQGGAQVEQQLQDLGLDRDVEGGEGLVGDQQFGFQGERARDPDALPLAAGELPGILVSIAGAQSHLGEQLRDPASPLPRRPDPVDVEDFQQGLGDGLARVEGRVRVLEDHLNPPAVGEELAFGDLHQVDPVEAHLAPVGIVEAQDAAAERALSAPRFPHQAQRVPPPEGERDAVDRAHRLRPPAQRRVEEGVREGKVLDEVADLQQRLSHRPRPPRGPP